MAVSPQEAYALSLVKLCSGNNLVGYTACIYGGVNKIGRHTTLNESRASGYPNDCPILEYFPHTALSPYGETGDTCRLLNLLNLFTQVFEAAARAPALGPRMLSVFVRAGGRFLPRMVKGGGGALYGDIVPARGLVRRPDPDATFVYTG